MNTKQIHFILILLLLSLFSQAQNVKLNGFAENASGKIIRLFTPSDYISNNETLLAIDTIDQFGAFQLSFSSKNIVKAEFQIDFYRAEIYLEPNTSYEIKIDSFNYRLFETKPPFLYPTDLNYSILKCSGKDINVEIRKFRTYHNEFIFKNFRKLYNLRKKELIQIYQKELDSIFTGVTHPYIKTMMLYNKASMEQLASTKSRRNLYKEYLISKNIQYFHPDYMFFFNDLYGNYFDNFSKTIPFASLKKMVNVSRSVTGILDSLGHDSLLINEVIRELVFLKGIQGLYKNQEFDKENILYLLKNFSNYTKFKEHKEIALNIIKQLTLFKPGNSIPDYIFRNQSNEDVHLKSFNDKPVYLFFTASFCQGCFPELDILKSLHQKYSNSIEIVVISCDYEYASYYHTFPVNRYPFTILHWNNQPEMLRNLGIRVFPTAMMIMPGMKVNLYSAPIPTENADALFNTISFRR